MRIRLLGLTLAAAVAVAALSFSPAHTSLKPPRRV